MGSWAKLSSISARRSAASVVASSVEPWAPRNVAASNPVTDPEPVTGTIPTGGRNANRSAAVTDARAVPSADASAICAWNCRNSASASARSTIADPGRERGPGRRDDPSADGPQIDEAEAARRRPHQHGQRDLLVAETAGLAEVVEQPRGLRRRRQRVHVERPPTYVVGASQHVGKTIAQSRRLGEERGREGDLQQPELHTLDGERDVAGGVLVAEPADLRPPLVAHRRRDRQEVDPGSSRVGARLERGAVLEQHLGPGAVGAVAGQREHRSRSGSSSARP